MKREAEEKKRLEIIQTFRNAPFEEIVARAEAKVWWLLHLKTIEHQLNQSLITIINDGYSLFMISTQI